MEGTNIGNFLFFFYFLSVNPVPMVYIWVYTLFDSKLESTFVIIALSVLVLQFIGNLFCLFVHTKPFNCDFYSVDSPTIGLQIKKKSWIIIYAHDICFP